MNSDVNSKKANMEEFGKGLGPSHCISDKRKPMKNYIERLASPPDQRFAFLFTP